MARALPLDEVIILIVVLGTTTTFVQGLGIPLLVCTMRGVKEFVEVEVLKYPPCLLFVLLGFVLEAA